MLREMERHVRTPATATYLLESVGLLDAAHLHRAVGTEGTLDISRHSGALDDLRTAKKSAQRPSPVLDTTSEAGDDYLEISIGWGTRIRTLTSGVRVRCSTIKLSPSRGSATGQGPTMVARWSYLSGGQGCGKGLLST